MLCPDEQTNATNKKTYQSISKHIKVNYTTGTNELQNILKSATKNTTNYKADTTNYRTYKQLQSKYKTTTKVQTTTNLIQEATKILKSASKNYKLVQTNLKQYKHIQTKANK